MSTAFDMLCPADLGITGFDSFRQVQLQAMEHVVDGAVPITGLCLPGGAGKSLLTVMLQRALGVRTVALTATKGLQDQYRTEHEQNGAVDVRGRANYQCRHKPVHCEDGAALGCRYAGTGTCSYEEQRDRARTSALVVTNYDYWMRMQRHTPAGLDSPLTLRHDWNGVHPPRVGLLILDEAHLAEGKLCQMMQVRVYARDLKDYGDWPRKCEEIAPWQEWVRVQVPGVQEELKTAVQELELHRDDPAKAKTLLRTVRRLERRLDQFRRIGDADADAWVCERTSTAHAGDVYNFDVAWGADYARQYLFCGVPQVVLMSATLRPKTMQLLGVGAGECTFREWPRIFPAHRNPVRLVLADKPGTNGGKPSVVRVQYKMSAEDVRRWMQKIDQFIGARLDRKGLVQTVSYDRQKLLMEQSKYRELMIGNTKDPDSEGASAVAEEFRKARAPRILVSPSFGTGWDFPGSACEYILIIKVPFPSAQSKVMKLRQKRDPIYPHYIAAQELAQSSWRGMRSEQDQCEVAIFDGHAVWFLHQYRKLFPMGYAERVMRVGAVPKPLEKL